MNNARNTFESFVVGSGNQFATAACQNVADAPARNYNPLFLFVHYYDPHMTWSQAPGALRAQFIDPTYTGPVGNTIPHLDAMTAAGAAMVVGAGLYTLRAGRAAPPGERRARQLPASPTPGAGEQHD